MHDITRPAPWTASTRDEGNAQREAQGNGDEKAASYVALAGALDALLSGECIHELGVFDATFVAKLWRRHLDGVVDAGHELWPVLMLQQWLLKYST